MDRQKILVVDDRPENLLALKGVLRSDDYDIVTAASGAEALEKLLQQRFALALLDVQMPGMDGIELAELMRGSEDTSSIPIIFVTAGMQDQAIMFRGFEAGAVDFLYKPLNERITRSKVRVFLELDRKNRQLQESNRELERFAYVASHDMKEPLRMISVYLTLLQRKHGATLEEEAKQYVSFAAEGARRLSSMIDSLIRSASIAHSTLHVAETDTSQVVKEVVESLETLRQEKNGTIRIGELPLLLCDKVQIRQLFQNLIGNGLKFSDGRAAEVVVDATRADGEWIFSVGDNGIGIPADKRQSIFEPFVRLHERAAFDGSGIGLSICKTIVEKHRGRIWVEPNGAKGTKFLFTIPLQPERARDFTRKRAP